MRFSEKKGLLGKKRKAKAGIESKTIELIVIVSSLGFSISVRGLVQISAVLQERERERENERRNRLDEPIVLSNCIFRITFTFVTHKLPKRICDVHVPRRKKHIFTFKDKWLGFYDKTKEESNP